MRCHSESAEGERGICIYVFVLLRPLLQNDITWDVRVRTMCPVKKLTGRYIQSGAPVRAGDLTPWSKLAIKLSTTLSRAELAALQPRALLLRCGPPDRPPGFPVTSQVARSSAEACAAMPAYSVFKEPLPQAR